MIKVQYLQQAPTPAPRPPVTAELCASIDRVEHVTKPAVTKPAIVTVTKPVTEPIIVTKAPIVTKPPAEADASVEASKSKRGRRPIGDHAMTAAERQARRRALVKVNTAADRASLASADA